MADLIATEFEAGVKTSYLKEDGKLIIARDQDVESVIESNKRAQNENTYSGRRLNGATFHKVASVPMIVLEKWMREKGINPFDKNDAPKILSLLRDPENKYLRTSLVKI